MADWERDDLTLLVRVASDLTALAATLAVLKRDGPTDPAHERAEQLIGRLHTSVGTLVDRLRA